MENDNVEGHKKEYPHMSLAPFLGAWIRPIRFQMLSQIITKQVELETTGNKCQRKLYGSQKMKAGGSHETQ
jgi:hypothetical protein